MKQLTKKLPALIAVFVFVAAALFVPVTAVSAQSSVNSGINSAKGDNVPESLFAGDSIFKTVVNTLLFVIGAISVIMLIWGGIRYTTSAGNSASVTSAKNTIMYAIIGLVIAFLAFAIVNWVIGAVNPATATP